MNAATKTAVISVFILYFFYGIFMPHYPVVNPDELWETSRGYYLKTMHHPGEPLLPPSVAPFYSTVGEMGWKSWCVLTVKSGTFAAMMSVLPVDELTAMRYGMFLWSVLACILTYVVARKAGLDKWFALLSAALLIVIPDFFSQIHRERSEIMICTCLLAGVWLFLEAMQSESPLRKKVFYFLTGLFAWLPALEIHPSSIVIPAVIGLLYFIFERKNLFSVNTLLLGIGLISGCIFFLFIMNSIKDFAVANGGGNYFKYQGPPVFLKGWKYVISIPYAFYNKFFVANTFTRPVSFLVFISSMILLARQFFKRINFIPQQSFIVISITVFLSLLVLYLFSGSFGNFNVIVAPFIAMTLAWYFQKRAASTDKKFRLSFAMIAILLMLTGTNVIGFPLDKKSATEYKRITTRVHDKTGSEAATLGLALYYNPFKDQPYYSNSWFNPYGGRAGQSFEDAVKVLKVSYVIVDDAFVGRALLDRGKSWTDSMFIFLNTNGKIVDEFSADYYVGNRVPAPDFYPSYWHYDSQKKYYIRKIRIVELTEN